MLLYFLLDSCDITFNFALEALDIFDVSRKSIFTSFLDSFEVFSCFLNMFISFILEILMEIFFFFILVFDDLLNDIQ